MVHLPPVPDPVPGLVLPLGSGSQPSPGCTSYPTLPHKASASTVPCPGAAPPLVALPVPELGCCWWMAAVSRPRLGASPSRAACLHGAVRLAWAGVGKTMGLLSCCFPPTEEPPRLLPRPPWLAARRARLGAAAARVLGHRRTCSLASLCPCYRRLVYWRIFPHWPGITQPHWLGGHPSRWAVPWSSHGGPHSGVGVAREQGSCSQGQCPMAGGFGHPGRAFWSIWGHATS